MKKWHMEGIVGSGNYARKLIIPDQRQSLGSHIRKLEESRRETLVTRTLRHGVALFLKYF